MAEWKRYRRGYKDSAKPVTLSVDATLCAIRKMGLTVSYAEGAFRLNTPNARADAALYVMGNQAALDSAIFIAMAEVG